eukprot:m.33344 g.33344  ORF g.33344 m.33344 type:complete len:96 (+) comp5094_c0_seq1:169-456(+)
MSQLPHGSHRASSSQSLARAARSAWHSSKHSVSARHGKKPSMLVVIAVLLSIDTDVVVQDFAQSTYVASPGSWQNRLADVLHGLRFRRPYKTRTT